MRDIGKSAVTIVTIERIGTEIGYIQVSIAVVVVIGRRGCHAISEIANTCRPANISKSAVSVVPVEDITNCILARWRITCVD